MELGSDIGFFDDLGDDLYRGRFRLFCVGLSLFERAWTLRGEDNVEGDTPLETPMPAGITTAF